MLELGYTVLGDFSKLSGNETDAPSTRLTKWNEIHCTCWIWSNQYKVLNLFLFSLYLNFDLIFVNGFNNPLEIQSRW